jgi:hypothetical protein
VRQTARQRAWETRRKTYGPKGHSGYQVGGRKSDASIETMRRLIARLVNEGIVSEGQASAAMLLPRIEVRAICDRVREGEEK